MAAADLRTKSVSDLQTQVDAKRTELAEARRSNAAGELSNTRRISELRKEIAMILTVLNEVKSSKSDQTELKGKEK